MHAQQAHPGNYPQTKLPTVHCSLEQMEQSCIARATTFLLMAPQHARSNCNTADNSHSLCTCYAASLTDSDRHTSQQAALAPQSCHKAAHVRCEHTAPSWWSSEQPDLEGNNRHLCLDSGGSNRQQQ